MVSLFLNTILIPGWSSSQAKSIAEAGYLQGSTYEQAKTFDLRSQSRPSQISYFLDLVGKSTCGCHQQLNLKRRTDIRKLSYLIINKLTVIK